MVGSILSTTVTVCVSVAVFPDPSVTVHVTVVFPSGKVPGALFVGEPTLQLSAAVALPSVTLVASQVPASTLTVTAAGAVMVGSILSTTVTVCVAVFPDPSVTVHITVVFPSGKVPGALFVGEP